MKVVAQLSFRKIRQIGELEGRNSAVFLAEDPQLGGELVLKEIPKSGIKDAAAFFAECQKVHASRHPNVVSVQYGCETDDHVCIAMPYYPAGSLAPRIKDGPLQVGEVIRLGVDMLTGLGAVHAAQIVHLDIKPTNVLFTSTGQALLADFGQSVWLNHATGLATDLPALYTRAIPPEVLDTGIATRLSDIFQAGLTLYRAVNGDPWYRDQVQRLSEPTGKARDRAIRNGRFPDRDAFLPHVPQGLCNLIRDTLSLNPTNRPQSAQEFRDRLGAVSPQIDWVFTEGPGKRAWSGARAGRQDVVVEHHSQSGEIVVYTVNLGGNRRRMANLCTTAAGDRAEVELRRVFRALSE